MSRLYLLVFKFVFMLSLLFLQIIPIETSMEGNRSLYPVLLYGALLLFTGIYCFMGVIGYLKYGNNVGQVLIWSLAGHTNPIVILMINATICIGVLFTYPLQNFVAVEIVEGIIFGKCKLLNVSVF